MRRRSNPEGRRLPVPTWDGPLEWSLWRLSLLLREIADKRSDDHKQEGPRLGASDTDAQIDGPNGGDPHEK